MKKIVSIAFAMSALVLSFTSCTKEGADQPAATSKKLEKIDYGGGSYESVSYNNSGLVSSVVNHVQYNGSLADHTVFTFTYSDSTLTDVHADDGTSFKYTYNNAKQVSRVDAYDQGGNLSARYNYAYQDGKLMSTDIYMRVPGTAFPANPTGRNEFEYYSSGNIKKLTLYMRNPNTNALVKLNEYVINEYDSHPNTTAVFENNPFLPIKTLVANNPVSETHYTSTGAVEETVAYTYTYDADGYPVSRKTVTKTPGMADLVENAVMSYK